MLFQSHFTLQIIFLHFILKVGVFNEAVEMYNIGLIGLVMKPFRDSKQERPACQNEFDKINIITAHSSLDSLDSRLFD